MIQFQETKKYYHYHSGPAIEDNLENLRISKFCKGSSQYPRAIIYSNWINKYESYTYCAGVEISETEDANPH